VAAPPAPSSSPRSSPPTTQAAPDADKPGGTLVVRFEGGNVNVELANVLELLRRRDLLPTEKYHVDDKLGPWDAIVKKTGLPKRCPKEMEQLLLRLNPRLKTLKQVPGGTGVVFLRSDRLEEIPVRRYFNTESSTGRERQKAVRKAWDDIVTSEDDKHLDLRGFSLTVPVPNEKIGRAAVDDILDGTKGNAFPHYRLADDIEPPVGPYYGVYPPEPYWGDEDHRKPGSNDQVLAAAYVNLNDLPSCAKTPCTASNCPDVVLVDSGIYTHRNLAGALTSGAEFKTMTEVGAAGVRLADHPDVTPEQHGTFMAGIIAARDVNHEGLIGVHPAVSLMTYDWESYKKVPDVLANRLLDREINVNAGLRVFVFATSWDLADQFPNRVSGWQTNSEKLRGQPTLARQIMGGPGSQSGSGSLWIAAAGQMEQVFDPDTGLGVDIEPEHFKLGPMNLGDLPNVIVVTACRTCDANDLHLYEKVNYSSYKRHGVHVVAPGDGIISTVVQIDGAGTEPPKGESRYARGNATSPATALTAGVVSAMTACYPTEFTEPWRVKERLQATSSPVFDGTDRDRFSAGIVDASMALRDPSLTYVTDTSGTRPIEIVQWCTEKIRFNPPASGKFRGLQDRFVSTKLLLRLKQRTATHEWIAYSQDRTDDVFNRGDIVVSGPAALQTSPVNGRTPLAKFREVQTSKGGTWSGDGPQPEGTLAIEDIVDLLLAPRMLNRTVGPCA
jgi:hypothetical protein